MSKKVAPLAHKMVSKLQTIIGAMELGEHELAVRQCILLKDVAREICEECHEMLKEHLESLRKADDNSSG